MEKCSRKQNHTLFNQHSSASSEPKLSRERGAPLVGRSRAKFGPAAPCSSLLFKLKTEHILTPRQKLKTSEKAAALVFLTHITKAHLALDRDLSMAHECWVGGNCTLPPGLLPAYMLFPPPITTQTFPQANNEGARTSAEAQCASP